MKIVFAFAFLAAAAAVTANSAIDPRPFIRQAVDNYFRDVEAGRRMTYLRRRDYREFDAGGKLTDRSLATRRIDFVDGIRVSWLVARDDQPLAAAELDAGREEARKAAAEWKRKPKAERERLAAESLKRSQQEIGYLRDFPEALDFKPAPPEQIGGRHCAVFDFSPRAGYRPPNMQARVFEKARGRIWIDAEEKSLVKLDGEVYDTVTIGGLLARIEKGTRFLLEQQRVEPGVWFPRLQSVRFDVRVMLVKQIHRRIESTFNEVRPYRGEVWN